ncbi:MAG: DUF2203 domain-containing protein [Chroococcidiopsidaceae cyanobacterium CP_BM_ER_R8_30]|nr:DUF2203 domain-containing protein [Chroococcidiopsidaceae cyanobacterium CP_BM_ER_R8_30]
MRLPQEPSEPDSQDFSSALDEVERSLTALKQRYIQVQHDQKRQAELRQRLNQVKKELHNTNLPQFRVELRQIKEQLEALEVSLESQLFTWGSLKEPFWQAVRFGGLGIVVGWILKSCAG